MRKQLLLATALSAVALAPALAQEIDAPQSGEPEVRRLNAVTVTARKKEETLKDVPISISVTPGVEIDKQGFRDLQSVVATIPAVNLSKAGGGDVINIRGVGSGENPGFEQSVGFVLDGVAIGRSRATRAGVTDIDRVEVLKGPQTTYFGANTIAGVINVASRGASLNDGFTGTVGASYEFETEETALTGAVNLPISDTFAVRVAGKYSDSEGYITDTFFNEKLPAIEDTLVRIGALWQPTSNFSADVRYTHVETEASSALDTQLVNCTPGMPVVTPAGPAFTNPAGFNCLEPGGTPVNDTLDYLSSSDLPGQFRKLDLDLISANLNYDIGDYTLTSVTGYYEFANDFLIDLDNTAVPSATTPSRFANSQFDDAEQFSQEFRISSPTSGVFDWTAGLYYQKEDVIFSNTLVIGFTFPFAPAVPPAVQLGARSAQEAETMSVFGAGTYEFTDRLRATLGLRYIEVEKTITQSPQQPGPIPSNLIPDGRGHTPFGGFAFDTDSRSDDDVLPSIDIQYDLTDDVNVYASFSQGFKAGGYSLANPPAGATTGFIQTFDPETVDAFEIGAKGTYFDGRVDANIALFSMEFSDRQVSSLADDGASLTQAVANAATSTSQGIEFNFAAQATDRLTLRGDFTLLDSTYDDFANSPCYTGQTVAQGCVGGRQDLSGETTTFAPEFSGAVSAVYEHPINNDYTLSIEPSLQFTDGYILIADANPLNSQDGFSKAHLRIGLSPNSGKWDLAFVGRNLTDETTSHFCQETPAQPAGTVSCAVDQPATYAIQARMNF